MFTLPSKSLFHNTKFTTVSQAHLFSTHHRPASHYLRTMLINVLFAHYSEVCFKGTWLPVDNPPFGPECLVELHYWGIINKHHWILNLSGQPVMSWKMLRLNTLLGDHKQASLNPESLYITSHELKDASLKYIIGVRYTSKHLGILNL